MQRCGTWIRAEPRGQPVHTTRILNQTADSYALEAVNGVPVAVEDEVAPSVKGEPVVAVRVKLKWSSHSVTASSPI
jgi:hypothetical protein